MQRSRSRRLGIGMVAAAVVLGLASWWALQGAWATDRSEPSSMSPVPSAPATDGDFHPTEAALAPVVSPGSVLALDVIGKAVAPPAWASLPHAVCTGRVVDESGAPVEAATVLCVPDAWVLQMLGFAEESGLVPIWWMPSGPLSAGRIEFDQLPSTKSDATGRFELRVPFLTDHAPVDGRGSARELPELLAHRDGSVPARRVCREFAPAGCDVGDIVLPRAAIVVGRTVDEHGRGVADVDIQALVEGQLTPVAGDAPQVSGPDPGLKFRFGRSDEDGRFRMPWLWSGTATMSFDAGARLPAARTGVVLVVGHELDLGDIVLERGSTISGRVIDEDGRPFPGAEVRISVHDFAWRDVEHPIHGELQVVRWGRLVHTATFIGEREGRYGVTRSGDDGSFVLGGLTRDEYGIYAAADGWEPDSVLHVATGSDGVSLQLRRQGRLRIRLVDDARGTPLDDARPSVCRGTGMWFEENDTLPVTMDPGSGPGVFIVDAVCPAPMAVVVESTSHGRQVARIEGLALGARPEEREVRVPLGATVSGRVVDEPGAPLEGATIRLSPYDHDQSLGLLPLELVVESGADGCFGFAGLTPAHWSLSAQLANYRSSRRTDVVVGAGETRSDIEFVMIRTGRVQGVVRDADGGVANGLMVAAKQDESSALAEGVTHTGSDGRYELELRPGTYAVLVSLSNSANSIRRMIEVLANETVVADFTLPAPAVLSGRVLASGSPCEGAAVSLRGQDLSLEGTTNEHGEYRLVLPSGGEGDLWARSPRGGLSPTQPVVVKAGESMMLDLEFGSLSCSGTVVDTLTGAGVAGARVSFSRRRGPNHTNPAVTDADGSFLVGDVAPGQWRLIAQHDRYLGMVEWMRVEIVEESDAPPIRLELTPGATVAGIVRTAAGAPTAQELEVSAWRDGESDAAADAQVESGSYELIRLETGRYTLLVTRAGQWWEDLDRQAREAIAKSRATVDVVAGQSLSFDLSLPPGER